MKYLTYSQFNYQFQDKRWVPGLLAGRDRRKGKVGQLACLRKFHYFDRILLISGNRCCDCSNKVTHSIIKHLLHEGNKLREKESDIILCLLVDALPNFLSLFFFGCRVYLNASLSISFTRASKWKQEFSFLEWKLFSLLIQHWPCPSSVTMENPAMPAESIQGLHMSITEGVHKRYKTYQSHSLFAKTLPIHMMWLKPTN